MENQEEKVVSTNFWKELFKLTIFALVIVVPFRLFIAQPFVVDGASMDPTFKDGQYLIVDELSYHLKDPERGSVVIFKYPLDPKKYFIKRVIALPGESVSIREGEVSIINGENPSGLLLDEPYIEFYKSENYSYTLKDGEYFVMGDNRLGSADSRLWGPVPRENVIGRPILRVWPMGLFPGQVSQYSNNQTQ